MNPSDGQEALPQLFTRGQHLNASFYQELPSVTLGKPPELASVSATLCRLQESISNFIVVFEAGPGTSVPERATETRVPSLSLSLIGVPSFEAFIRDGPDPNRPEKVGSGGKSFLDGGVLRAK